MLGIVYQVHKFSRDSAAAFSFSSSSLKNVLDEELARLVAAPDQRARGGVEETKFLADGLPGCKLGGRHVLLHLAKLLPQSFLPQIKTFIIHSKFIFGILVTRRLWRGARYALYGP